MFERDIITVHLEKPFANIRQIACAYNNSFVILFAPNSIADVSYNPKLTHVSQAGKILFEWETSYEVNKITMLDATTVVICDVKEKKKVSLINL